MLAMSGGVDSSVAGALLLEAGHEVVGVTMRLWGGDSDTGCCSVADVDDARRVAQQLGIDHVVFNFGDEFDAHVVTPYVDAHTRGVTPNPCIECNRHLKFDRLSARADLLGFDAVATGHHARVVATGDGRFELHRGVDAAKDQSYVVHMLTEDQLARTLFPVGELTKDQVRRRAERIGLRTASKPDSQDVCFITSTGGRETFLGGRIPLRPASVVDRDGTPLGEIPSVELVTLGQRRGLGLPGGGPKRYVVGVDVQAATVVVGDAGDLLVPGHRITGVTWTAGPPAELDGNGMLLVQCSAHGRPRAGRIATEAPDTPDTAGVVVTWDAPQPAVAPGQSIVFYDRTDTRVVGGGTVAPG